MFYAYEFREAALEFGIVPAGCQPPVKAGIDHRHQLLGINQFAGRGNDGLSRLERLCAPVGGFEFPYKIENGFAVSGLSKAAHGYPLSVYNSNGGMHLC